LKDIVGKKSQLKLFIYLWPLFFSLSFKYVFIIKCQMGFCCQ